MKTMQKFNKATAAVIAGAIATAVGAFFGLAPELIGSIGTVLTAALVYFVPNQ